MTRLLKLCDALPQTASGTDLKSNISEIFFSHALIEIIQCKLLPNDLPYRFVGELVKPQPGYQVLVVVFVDIILGGAAGGEGAFTVAVSQLRAKNVVHFRLGSEELPEQFLLLLS